MTEQEVEALIARLERIWGVTEIIPDWGQKRMRPAAKFASTGALETKLASYLYLRVSPPLYKTGWGDLSFCLRDSTKVAGLETRPEGHIQLTLQSCRRNTPEELEAFSHQWMDFFRRNCWLSGCDIEASAHEKAEWVQGFSREELEAWNLKM